MSASSSASSPPGLARLERHLALDDRRDVERHPHAVVELEQRPERRTVARTRRRSSCSADSLLDRLGGHHQMRRRSPRRRSRARSSRSRHARCLLDEHGVGRRSASASPRARPPGSVGGRVGEPLDEAVGHGRRRRPIEHLARRSRTSSSAVGIGSSSQDVARRTRSAKSASWRESRPAYIGVGRRTDRSTRPDRPRPAVNP